MNGRAYEHAALDRYTREGSERAKYARFARLKANFTVTSGLK